MNRLLGLLGIILSGSRGCCSAFHLLGGRIVPSVGVIRSSTPAAPLGGNVAVIPVARSWHSGASSTAPTSGSPPPRSLALLLRAQRRWGPEGDDEEDEDLVRVPRGGGRRGTRGRRDDAYYAEDDGDGDERSSYGDRRSYPSSGRDPRLYEDDEDEFDDDEDDDDEDDWSFDVDDDGSSSLDAGRLLENAVLPNPLLDSMDPDGAADRFPELARDPRFWIDMALFVAFLNFLSSVGPQDPFPDIPWF